MGRLRDALRGIPLIPAGILLIVVVAGLLGPLAAPYNPEENDLMNSFLPPLWKAGGLMAHPLGTDQFGRDVLSRLIVRAVVMKKFYPLSLRKRVVPTMPMRY